jgi:membrane dipeptidase
MNLTPIPDKNEEWTGFFLLDPCCVWKSRRSQAEAPHYLFYGSEKPLFVIDMHLDLAWNAIEWDRDLALPVSQIRSRELASGRRGPGRGTGTVSLAELQAGSVGVVAGTLLARYDRVRPPVPADPRSGYDCAESAHAAAVGQLAWYRAQARCGRVRILSNGADLDAHVRLWQTHLTSKRPAELAPPIGVILSMEGADPILHPEDVDDWWGAGLRVLSLSHYGNGTYSHGTDSPGPLHPQASSLLRAMQRLGLILDVTHLADEALDQVLDSFDGPVVASHHNCRALVNGQRQLRDQDIRRIVGRRGVIGAAFDNWMLDPLCGQTGTATVRRVASLENVVDHIEHVCQIAGSARHAALGTDLDGGFGYEQSPLGIDSIADLQKLPAVLERRGYSVEDIRGILHDNWFAFFRRVWGHAKSTRPRDRALISPVVPL